jgi:dTDP-4-dehydrorhamnose 3,5-epimerase
MDFITLDNKQNHKIIQDILMYPLKVNQDESGILVETLRKDWPDIYGPGREFSMQYFSVTESMVARDEDQWHMHPTVQEDRFLVANGAIITAVADPREGSETKGVLNLFLMEARSNPYILLIPKQTLHGFMVISKGPAILLNFPTALYNPQEEGRVPYDQAAVKFPDGTAFAWQKVREEFQRKQV